MRGFTACLDNNNSHSFEYLLESTKVNRFFGFTKQNEEIFKKKLFVFVNISIECLREGLAWAISRWARCDEWLDEKGDGGFRFVILNGFNALGEAPCCKRESFAAQSVGASVRSLLPKMVKDLRFVNVFADFLAFVNYNSLFCGWIKEYLQFGW